jgi:hypothetical protein
MATPPIATPPVSAPPPATSPVVAPPVDPATIAATARLEAEPAKTVASNATPRGPEIRIAARLDAGDGFVRELPAETSPHELTEETK